LSAFTTVEGAENGLTNVTVVSSPGYSVQDSNVAASGTYSFHLAQPNGADQFLTLNPVFLLRTNSQLSFSKRLGSASTNQFAKAQISTNRGASWQDLWLQTGSGGVGESSFSGVTNSLSSYAGQTVQIRFEYEHPLGSYYSQTNVGFGFYVDDISISNAEELLSQVTGNVTATSFYFLPANSSDYLLAVRALLPGRTLNWGTPFRVSISSSAPIIQIVAQPVLSGTQIQMDFTVASYRSGMSFQLWKAPSPDGAWALDSSASIVTITPNSTFRATTQTGSASSAFYRVKALY
jgi:hypothetical protein